MGMLDTSLGKPFGESFNEGDVFVLEGAKMGPEIPTVHGKGRPAMLKIQGEWFSLFGVAITNQVQGMDDEDREKMSAGEFRCKLVRRKTKSGQDVKLLVSPDEPTESDDIPF